MRGIRSSLFAAPADRVWALFKDPETFRFIVAGMIGLDNVVLPADIREGTVIRMHVRPLHLPGGYAHEIRVVHLDDVNRSAMTEEHGGVIHRWRHRITVETLDAAHCQYTDNVDIDAGLFTPAIWAFARAFYRYRHGRWRRLLAQPAPIISAS
jgi:ligand-binding SRPBCC domain-containing protein